MVKVKISPLSPGDLLDELDADTGLLLLQASVWSDLARTPKISSPSKYRTMSQLFPAPTCPVSITNLKYIRFPDLSF